jgi:hypothetical protein
MRLLLSLGVLLWVASRVHVAVRLMGIPVFSGNALELAIVTAFAAIVLLAAIFIWLAARSVLGRPFIPRRRAVAW